MASARSGSDHPLMSRRLTAGTSTARPRQRPAGRCWQTEGALSRCLHPSSEVDRQRRRGCVETDGGALNLRPEEGGFSWNDAVEVFLERLTGSLWREIRPLFWVRRECTLWWARWRCRNSAAGCRRERPSWPCHPDLSASFRLSYGPASHDFGDDLGLTMCVQAPVGGRCPRQIRGWNGKSV